MIKLLTLKLKIILGFLILIVGLIIGGYVYLNKMIIKQGNLNINKTNPIDKLCNYTVFSDFYYHITDYSKGENSFAQLTPVKTDICYNLESESIELKPNVTSDTIIIDDEKGAELSKKIALLENFQEEYAKIVATQDKDYFIKSYELSQQTYKTLYNEELPMKPKDVSDYYTNILNLPIENLVINHYKLTKIKNTPNQALKDGEWQPNILEWNFGENDKIYFKYVRKLLNNDLDKFVNSIYSKKKKTIVKLTKFNNNKLSKMFLVFDDINNKISVFFMDKNGYLYTLILKVQNPKAFDTYFNDFMKIAYGIYFIDSKKGAKEWAELKKEKETNSMQRDSTSPDVFNGFIPLLICNKSYEIQLGNDLLQHFNQLPMDIEIYNYNKLLIGIAYCKGYEDINVEVKKITKDEFFKYYTDEMREQFELHSTSVGILFEAYKKYDSWLTDGKEKIKNLCPTGDLQCIVNLKSNNWEITDE